MQLWQIDKCKHMYNVKREEQRERERERERTRESERCCLLESGR